MMKKIIYLLTALVFGTASITAATTEDKVAIPSNAYRYNNSFIFVENGITFSVYPDGEFDFYIDNRVNFGASYSSRRANITFNSGFDYNPFVQYDDYGAVIQVENVPVYYDAFGRVTQIGDVDVWYRNGRVNRIGGMYAYYNNRGFYSHHTGFINVYNRRYVYRPFHRFFARPALNLCLVYNRPYRQYYRPIRYTYYRPYMQNRRRAYAKIGKMHKYDNRNRRTTVYRNDKRVAARENTYKRRGDATRSNRTIAQRGDVTKTKRTVVRTNPQRGTVSRTTTSRTMERGNTNGNRTVRQSTTVRKNTGNVHRSTPTRKVTKREVTARPNNRTVTRSTTTMNRKPVTRSVQRTVTPQRTQKRVSATTSRSSRSPQATSRSASPRRSNSTVSTRSPRRQ